MKKLHRIFRMLLLLGLLLFPLFQFYACGSGGTEVGNPQEPTTGVTSGDSGGSEEPSAMPPSTMDPTPTPTPTANPAILFDPESSENPNAREIQGDLL